MFFLKLLLDQFEIEWAHQHSLIQEKKALILYSIVFNQIIIFQLKLNDLTKNIKVSYDSNESVNSNRSIISSCDSYVEPNYVRKLFYINILLLIYLKHLEFLAYKKSWKWIYSTCK